MSIVTELERDFAWQCRRTHEYQDPALRAWIRTGSWYPHSKTEQIESLEGFAQSLAIYRDYILETHGV